LSGNERAYRCSATFPQNGWFSSAPYWPVLGAPRHQEVSAEAWTVAPAVVEDRGEQRLTTEYRNAEVPAVVAQRIVHGSVQHLELLFGAIVAMTLSIADGSAIIPACP